MIILQIINIMATCYLIYLYYQDKEAKETINKQIDSLKKQVRKLFALINGR